MSDKNILIFLSYTICVFLLFGQIRIVGQTTFNKLSLSGVKIYNEKLINTANMESSPAFMGDKVAFVYSELKGKLFDKEINESFFNLGYADVNLDNSLQNRNSYNTRINSELHEGAMSYDANQNMMFLTRSDKVTRRIKGINTDTFYLRILSADLNASKPTVKQININVENYSVCHPSLSTDGKTMVFSTNMPGGFGKMDLCFAYFNGTEWVGVMNAGGLINTSGNEVFPTLVNDTLLVFASNREKGIGNFDLYVSKLKDGFWQTAELLPPPFNSPYDDLGLIVRENYRSGYFSSNRPGGKGNDDIYRFESLLPIFGEDQQIMATSVIHVLDKLTLDPVSNAQITITPLEIDINNFTLSSYNIDMLSGRDPGDLVLKLSPKKGQSFPSFNTNMEGIANFQIKKNQKYLIKVDSKDYSTLSLIYDYLAFGPDFNIVLEPVSEEEDMPVLDNDETQITTTVSDNASFDSLLLDAKVGDIIVFDNIYFDYNSTNLIVGATLELDALIRYLQLNENVKVRLESHTDSRGTAAYNLQLSINRANTVRKYMTDNGINEDRINIRGYGESRLRNACSDNVPCTEQLHRFNRRTEVVIEQN